MECNATGIHLSYDISTRHQSVATRIKGDDAVAHMGLPPPSKWNQGSTFVISNWEAPQAAPGDGWAQRWDNAVQEMAAANFTVLLGGSGSGRLPTPGGLNKSTIQSEDFRVQLAVAKKYGMRLIGPTDPSYAALDMQTDVCMGSR